MIQTIDGSLFRRMILSAAAVVEQNKQCINELNVFPVPDGDTGINMSMTLNAAAAELQKLSHPTLTKAADTAANAMLRGARGNSGVILSLLFRGFSKAWKGLEEADGFAFADALSSGVDAAYRAIMKPTEGTILTVSRVAAEKAAAALEGAPEAEPVLLAALEGARAALKETVEQNPVLKKAGVVDAGGKGFVCILEGMSAAARGEDIAPAETAPVTKEAADFAEFDTENIQFAYCTEFIVSRDNNKDPQLLHTYLAGIGDCLVLVPDDEIIKVHVHTNEPGNVITHALEYGMLLTVKIENMKEQHTQKVVESSASAAETAPAAAEIAAPEKTYGIVSVCAGEGLAAAFRDLGADRIVEGGQTMNPSTEDILEAVNETPAEIVYVFPNNKNIILAAEQAVPLTTKKVIVVPTKTIPQGITALFGFDPSLSEAELTETLMTGFDGVSTAQITYAARNSDFDGRQIAAGEYLGLYNGGLKSCETDLTAVLKAMAEEAQAEDREIITIFYGADIAEDTAKDTALQIFKETCTDAEINLVYGGQPVYYYLISLE